MKHIKQFLRQLFHPSLMRRAQEQMLAGVVIIDPYGGRFTVVSSGSGGIMIRAYQDESNTRTLSFALLGPPKSYEISWGVAARFFTVERSAGDSVEEALKPRRKLRRPKLT